MSNPEIVFAFSGPGEYKIVIEPPRTELKKIGGMDIAVPNRGKIVEFQRLRRAAVCKALPGRQTFTADGDPIGKVPQANGRLLIKDEAARLEMKEEDLVEFLMQHKHNVLNGGREFVLVDAEGVEQVARDTQDSEGTSETDYIVDNGGTYFCEACSQHIPNPQGVARHKQGQKHLTNVAQKQNAALDGLLEAVG